VAGSVLCFPYGRGSTVGSYSLYQLKVNNVAPNAIVNQSAEPIVAAGAIMSAIPMVHGVDVSLVRTCDRAVVDADEGTLELPDVEERPVVTGIVRHKGRILLLQRSNSVGSYRGQWAGVSGYIEKGEQPEAAAWRELEEELGLGRARLAKASAPERFRDREVVWTVHPFLFDVKEPKVKVDWEHQGYEWVSPKDVSRFPTVPGLQRLVCKLLA
jgi:8-oxo-dGTP pyrophosphatase MutT (NUDIX family)